METTRALMPRARQDELVVEELQDETLVYDLERHKGPLPESNGGPGLAALRWTNERGRCGRVAGGAIGHPGRRGGRVDGAGPLEQSTLAE